MALLEQRAVLSLPRHFDELLKNINPDGERLVLAQTIPGELRDYLQSLPTFATISPHTRLTGSYARYTATGQIKDVDLLTFVPLNKDGSRPDAVATLDSLHVALKGLPEALDRPGEAQVLRKQRRSIHVKFTEEDFHLDVVPALLPGGIEAALLVPDKDWEKWVPSHPLGYRQALSDLNAAHGEKVVPLIKLVKHWRIVHMTYLRPKSYYLEALVYQHLTEGWVGTVGKGYAELFTDLLRSVRERYLPILDEDDKVPKIPDPMLRHNLAFNWSRKSFVSFMGHLDESIGWAERALAKGRDDLDAAVALWRKVFGEAFPDSPELRKLQLADWIAAGSVYVAGDGQISTVRPTTARVVESPKHRFYGQAR